MLTRAMFLALAVLSPSSVGPSSPMTVPAAVTASEPAPDGCDWSELLAALGDLHAAVTPKIVWAPDASGKLTVVDARHPEYERQRLDDLHAWKAAMKRAKELIELCEQPSVIIGPMLEDPTAQK
jgi:hypothetical protein